MTEVGVTEPSFDFGGAAPQEVVVVDELSMPMTASSLSELECSVQEDVTKGVAVNDCADILGRCASTTALCKLRASTFGLVSGVVTEPSLDSGGAALQEVVAVNGLSIPATARSLSAPSCSVAEVVTEDSAIDDNADIPAACDGTARPGRRCALTSRRDSAVVGEPSFDFGGTAPQEFVSELSPWMGCRSK